MRISVLWCRSLTGKEFPVAQFSADTDMATDGFVALSSVSADEIVVTKLTGEEYNDDDMHSCQARVNRELGREDLRIADLVRVVNMPRSPAGLGFGKIRKQYPRPTLYFSDIVAGAGEAPVVREETQTQFKKAGGKIRMLREV